MPLLHIDVAITPTPTLTAIPDRPAGVRRGTVQFRDAFPQFFVELARGTDHALNTADHAVCGHIAAVSLNLCIYSKSPNPCSRLRNVSIPKHEIVRAREPIIARRNSISLASLTRKNTRLPIHL